MKRENIPMELVKSTSHVRRLNVRLPYAQEEAGGRNAVERYLTGSGLSERNAAPNASAKATGSRRVSPTAHAKQEVSVAAVSSVVGIRQAIGRKIPRLTEKKVRIVGVLPTTLRVILTTFKGPAQKDVRQPAAAPERTVTGAPAPPAVPVKVIPLPGRKDRRPAKPQEEISRPVATKPLKVIRRRREEAPKVFETAPMPFPKAMLAGVKVSDKDAADNLD